MFGPFMYVFFILSVEVGYRVISYFSDKRIRVPVFFQTLTEFDLLDRF